MAYDSNMGFHQGMMPSSFYDHHMVSFQSGPVSSSNMIIPTAIHTIDAIKSTESMVYTPTPSGNNMSLMIPSGSSTGVLRLDPIPGLKHDSGLAVDWSLEEQALLERGLVKYSNEPNIMKYIKIAATLHNKAIRDVALRCRWMTNKENGILCKQEEYYTGKKMKDRKGKQMDCSSRANVVSSQPPNIPSCSFTMHHVDSNNCITHEVSTIDGATQLLLEETTQLLCQIENNLGTLKLRDNIDLFFHMKNNVTAILKRMNEMPGIMSQMPPLLESIDEKLLGTVLAAPQVTGTNVLYTTQRHSFEAGT